MTQSKETQKEFKNNKTDNELKEWLTEQHAKENTVAYVSATHYFKVFLVEDSPSILYECDLGKESTTILKQIAKSKKLKSFELSVEEITEIKESSPLWELKDSSCKDIEILNKERKKFLGRGEGITDKTRLKVFSDAGFRCMYRGCGKNLSEISLTTKTSHKTYLAHIIASNPKGPRGNESESHKLSDSPENIMLMCDEHHRLIDRVDVSGHPTEYLQQMREEHVDRTIQLLDGLSYPSAQVITLLSDIGNVSTNISRTELFDSVLSENLGPLTPKHSLRGTQRDNRELPQFWSNFLNEQEQEIRNLLLNVSNKPSQINSIRADILAIFPLHLVPILVLAGRIIGEARRVEIFQYHRELKTWKWQKTDSNPNSKFSISDEISQPQDTKETILSIELTAELDLEALPKELQNSINNKEIGWIRLKNSDPDIDCINTKEKLEDFTDLARIAVKKIQDEWKSKTVHVFGVAPASTLFKFGQILQAGYQSNYHIYDRPSNKVGFKPAIEITGDEVASLGESNPKIIPLKL